MFAASSANGRPMSVVLGLFDGRPAGQPPAQRDPSGHRQAGVGGPDAPPADGVGVESAGAGVHLVAPRAVLGARPVPPAAAAAARARVRRVIPAPVGWPAIDPSPRAAA